MTPRRIAAVAAKEARELWRDPITIAISLLMPLVMLFLFGYAISLDVKNISLGVLDRDQTPASRRLIDSFIQGEYFRLTRAFTSAHDLDAALQRGGIDIALIIPEALQTTLVRGSSPSVQLVVDGTYSATAQVVANYADAIVRSYGTSPGDHIQLEMRVWYNAPMRSANYIVPGLFGVILMAFPPLLTALAIVREKESATIQQIFASPLTSVEFILGKLIPYGVIAFIEILMVMVGGVLWFDIPFRGNAGLLLAAGSVYVLCTVGLGLLISTIAQRQVTAMLLAIILTLMPSFLFSGFLFPIFTMPYILQLYTLGIPARYFVDLSREIVLKGSGLQETWPNIAILITYTVVVFLAAAGRLQKKVA